MEQLKHKGAKVTAKHAAMVPNVKWSEHRASALTLFGPLLASGRVCVCVCGSVVYSSYFSNDQVILAALLRMVFSSPLL